MSLSPAKASRYSVICSPPLAVTSSRASGSCWSALGVGLAVAEVGPPVGQPLARRSRRPRRRARRAASRSSSMSREVAVGQRRRRRPARPPSSAASDAAGSSATSGRGRRSRRPGQPARTPGRRVDRASRLPARTEGEVQDVHPHRDHARRPRRGRASGPLRPRQIDRHGGPAAGEGIRLAATGPRPCPARRARGLHDASVHREAGRREGAGRLLRALAGHVGDHHDPAAARGRSSGSGRTTVDGVASGSARSGQPRVERGPRRRRGGDRHEGVPRGLGGTGGRASLPVATLMKRCQIWAG